MKYVNYLWRAGYFERSRSGSERGNGKPADWQGACFLLYNSAARSNYGIEANGENFSDALEERSDRYDLVTFWPINLQADCVNLLLDYLRVIRYGSVFTIRNNCYGAPKDFQVYDTMMEKPKNRETAKARINGILDFPSLNEQITLQLYSYGKTLPEVTDKLNVFKRQIFKSWKNRAYEMFESTGLFADCASDPNIVETENGR